MCICRLENHSSVKNCCIYYTIIRPLINETQDEEMVNSSNSIAVH